MLLEREMLGLAEHKKQELRRVLEHEEIQIQKELRKKITVADFESLAVIGRGAFGEVRLVRRKGNNNNSGKNKSSSSAAADAYSAPDASGHKPSIFALKSMKKEMMVMKNQVHHVKAERDALAKADDSNQWLTVLHYSFFDETHLYMVMEFLPGGDLMSLLIKEDTFSESVTRFFMAEAAQAISSVHALGYIHRDIKPDNMLLDARGHLKLTDLGLCKKVGEVSPAEEPEAVLEMLRRQGLNDTMARVDDEYRATPINLATADAATASGSSGTHRSSDDAMAMSIDDSGNNGGLQRDAKTRREVRASFGVTIEGRLRALCLTILMCLSQMAFSTVGTPDYIGKHPSRG